MKKDWTVFSYWDLIAIFRPINPFCHETVFFVLEYVSFWRSVDARAFGWGISFRITHNAHM